MIYMKMRRPITAFQHAQPPFRFTTFELSKGEYPVHWCIPGQLLSVCRTINEEAASIQYDNLRIRSTDLDEALRFVTNIGSRNAGLMWALRVVIRPDRSVRLERISDWLEDNGEVLGELKKIFIEYIMDTNNGPAPSEPLKFGQRLVEMLWDNPWVSHWMNWGGFDTILDQTSWRLFEIDLFK